MHDVVFSHDGQHLYAAGEGYGVEVISTETWQREAPLLFDTSRVFALARHPDRDTLAIGGFGWAAVDATTGRLQVIPDQRREEIAAMRFSRSGHELAIADLAVRVWDVALRDDGTLETQPADRLIVTNDRVHDLDFDPDGPLPRGGPRRHGTDPGRQDRSRSAADSDAGSRQAGNLRGGSRDAADGW